MGTMKLPSATTMMAELRIISNWEIPEFLWGQSLFKNGSFFGVLFGTIGDREHKSQDVFR